jgi:hypothetical protein
VQLNGDGWSFEEAPWFDSKAGVDKPFAFMACDGVELLATLRWVASDPPSDPVRQYCLVIRNDIVL